MVPSGLISVMPQAWITCTLYFFSNVSIIERGQAEPPIITRLRCGSLMLCSSMYASAVSHTVGTAAVMVTFSVVSSSHTAGPSSFGPGFTSLAPTIGALNARPLALAWNIGTTGRMESRLQTACASVCAHIIACNMFERCEYSTPLGLPVVRDV